MADAESRRTEVKKEKKMTRRYGRQGRKYNRAGLPDPRGHWGTGVPASAGFMPEKAVQLVDGRAFAGGSPQLAINYPDRPPSSSNAPPQSTGMKLSRQGAQKTRLKHGLMRRKR